MAEFDDFRSGDEVEYIPRGRNEGSEYGEVTSKSGMSRLVYVLFEGDDHPKACYPEDLRKVPTKENA